MTADMTTNRLTPEEAQRGADQIQRVVTNIENVVVGKRDVVELVVLALVSRGHVLIEDVPGLGKTTLAKALASSVDCSFKRIQFTPDIMPSDVTGFSIYNQKTGEFEFRPGSVMSNIVLADEINRASAKTQSSLLEAMEERQVTVDSTTYRLAEPFMVLATQNPVESFGTYPLPEAQLDRFMMKLSVGYPSVEEEIRFSSLPLSEQHTITPVIGATDVLALRKLSERVHIHPALSRYIVELVTATRNHPDVLLGSSPRGSITLHAGARSYALAQGRTYVTPEDVKHLATPVLAHRLVLSQEAKVDQKDPADVVADVLHRVVVPTQ